MKLLFDQNLSRKLVNRLADTYPNSSYIQFHQLAEADDNEVWAFAKNNGFCIVTQDADFASNKPFVWFSAKGSLVALWQCTDEIHRGFIAFGKTRYRTVDARSTFALLRAFIA